jgi:nucleoside 2-deoxyribosyltransferase
MTLRIYLAGPGVFRPDALEHGARLKALCAEFGFEGLYPLDKVVPERLSLPAERAAWLYRANVALIEQADLLLADLDFFRGAEPDSGTSFEVGYAAALGKPVYAHLATPGSYAERLRARFPELCEGGDCDRDGFFIEDFGLPLNLMLAVPATVVCGDARAALARIAADVGCTAGPRLSR